MDDSDKSEDEEKTQGGVAGAENDDDFDFERQFDLMDEEEEREKHKDKGKEKEPFPRASSVQSDGDWTPGGEKKEKGVTSDREEEQKKNKILKIERLITKDDGSRMWTTEIVTDQRVIKMYLAEKQALEERRKSAATPIETEASKKEKRRIEERLRKLKLVKEQIELTPQGEIGPGVSKKSKANLGAQLKMKCGACGAVGHMKTNRMCSLFGKKPESDTVIFKDLDLEKEIRIDASAGKLVFSKKILTQVLEKRENANIAAKLNKKKRGRAPKPRPPPSEGSAATSQPATSVCFFFSSFFSNFFLFSLSLFGFLLNALLVLVFCLFWFFLGPAPPVEKEDKEEHEGGGRRRRR